MLPLKNLPWLPIAYRKGSKLFFVQPKHFEVVLNGMLTASSEHKQITHPGPLGSGCDAEVATWPWARPSSESSSLEWHIQLLWLFQSVPIFGWVHWGTDSDGALPAVYGENITCEGLRAARRAEEDVVQLVFEWVCKCFPTPRHVSLFISNLALFTFCLNSICQDLSVS